jgi:hypothetical protein
MLEVETKPGLLTTEFWKTLTLNVLGTVQLCTGAVDVNNKYVVLAMAIITGVYSASRGLAKHGVPAIAAPALPPDQGDAGQPEAQAPPAPAPPLPVAGG